LIGEGQLGIPSSGPATEAIPHIDPINPKAAGRFRRGKQYERITIAPLKSPPTPIPATARPTIKAMLLGATAQMRDLLPYH